MCSCCLHSSSLRDPPSGVGHELKKTLWGGGGEGKGEERGRGEEGREEEGREEEGSKKI